MDATQLASVVGLLVALSVASERVVEIVKGAVHFLDTEQPDADRERVRRVALHVLAVVAGVVTAFLARPAIPTALPVTDNASILALGLLASGGSGLWNSVLTYALETKNIQELIAKETQRKAQPDKAADAEIAELKRQLASLRGSQ
jgi:hypothetical protein